jgi:hypothetical protein
LKLLLTQPNLSDNLASVSLAIPVCDALDRFSFYYHTFIGAKEYMSNFQYEVSTRFLASAFVEAGNITPKGKDIAALSGSFDEDDFLPILAEEFSPTGTKQRIAFRTPNGEWFLMVQGERIDLTKNPTSIDGSNMGDFGDFCKSANKIIGIVLKYYNLTPHRLAAVTEGFITSPTPTIMEQVRDRLFIFPPSIQDKDKIFEWDWRIVRSIEREFAGLVEPTNNITLIKRARVGITINNQEVSPKSTRLFGQVDINTSPENINNRFDHHKMSGFYEGVVDWHQTLINEIFSHILG